MLCTTTRCSPTVSAGRSSGPTAIGWLCAPTWHDEAVFASLVGGRGAYAVTPAGRYVFGGYYEEGTLIWRSRWVTDDGIVECREALAFPGAPDRLVLLRQLRAVDGPARVSVVLDPRGGYGATPVDPGSVRRSDGGVWELRTGRHRLRWQGAPQAVPGERGLTADIELKPGERHELVLECAVSPCRPIRPSRHRPGPPPKPPGTRRSPRSTTPSPP